MSSAILSSFYSLVFVVAENELIKAKSDHEREETLKWAKETMEKFQP